MFHYGQDGKIKEASEAELKHTVGWLAWADFSHSHHKRLIIILFQIYYYCIFFFLNNAKNKIIMGFNLMIH